MLYEGKGLYGLSEGAGISRGSPGVGSSNCASGSSFDRSSCVKQRSFHQYPTYIYIIGTT